jgi:hypothetical protein
MGVPAMGQRVIVANFGRGNYLWEECKRNATVATFEDEDLRPFWLSGDRDAYVRYCIAKKKTFDGGVPTANVASRWFGTGETVSSTVDDIWIHKDGDDLWWTVSLNEPATVDLRDAQPGTSHVSRVFVIQKAANRWSRVSRRGTPLTWSGLHPKAQDFLRTQATLITLAAENSAYARALINGDDLSPWHNRRAWKQKLDESKRAPVAHRGAQSRAVWRMVETALRTVAGANGQLEDRTAKVKESHFDSREAFETYVNDLITTQGGLCALSALPLQFDGEFTDIELLASLDRIDSAGHYAPGNLQVVCRFINRWKSADDNDEFVRLLAVLRDTSR